MTTTRENVIHAEAWHGSQSLNATYIVKVPNSARRLRVRICRDAHDRQSFAICEMLTPEGWTELVRRGDIKVTRIADFSYVTRDEKAWKDAAADDANDLFRLAQEILP
jgi:hypothetical protein